MSSFSVYEALPGIFHIGDAMGVYMTLLIGNKCALLVDTGYGLEDVSAFIRKLTDKPLSVLLTHAHHDHALGARWFEETHMFPQDLKEWPAYTGEKQRRSVAEQARAKGLCIPSDYLSTPVAQPRALEEGAIDLGGLTAQIICCPGHTPGSAVVFVPERGLLLTGDDWNPCTWLFFPEALPVQGYRAHLRSLLAYPFEHVLCSHREALYPRAALHAFLQGLTDDALDAAQKADMGREIDTRQVLPAEGQQFVFDYGKFKTVALCGEEECV